MRKMVRLVRQLGAWNAFAYILKIKCLDRLVATKGGIRSRLRHGTLRVRGIAKPLSFRYGTSDPLVFWQVFVREDYRAACVGDPKIIVDCGANVGYTSAYFANRYPQAQIFALEPDRNNREVMFLNLRGFGSRVTIINKAVWSKVGGLRIVAAPPGSRGEWGIHVRECQSAEDPDVLATTLDVLMKENGLCAIDILKLDIEGAELELFGPGCDAWLSAVKTIIVELHGPRCKEVFSRAVTCAGFTSRELGNRMVLALKV